MCACVIGIAVWCGSPSALDAETSPMSFTYYDGQVELGLVKRFHWQVLAAALERTRAAYGDFRIVALTPAPISRQRYELSHPNSPISVAAFSGVPDNTAGLVPVRIPVEQGLQSYRVLLIREGDQGRFDRIRSLDDLKALRFGLLPGWTDARVMARNGMTLVEGQSYAGLFRMLSAGRFDAFSRGTAEVIDDFTRGRQMVPGLAIEKHLLLHYSLPVYFWFSDEEEGRRRAERVRAGLTSMIEDGSLAAMVQARYRTDLAELNLAGRLVLELSNPLLDGLDPLDDDRLWFRPH